MARKIGDNLLSSLSTNFLFINGDINLRHSVENIGELYKIEVITLLLGLVLFFSSKNSKELKILLGTWFVLGLLPTALTQDGGTHATRLILVLPVLLILISYGFYKLPKIAKPAYLLGLAFMFAFYLHTYYVHYPWYSERSWHAGFKEAVIYAKESEPDYQNIVFSNAYEPPEIFFAGFYPWDPNLWQKGFETGFVEGFGNMKKQGNFYFGQIAGGFSNLEDNITKDTLYIAAARELTFNASEEPKLIPGQLELKKTVYLPSGEPIFYMFTHK